MVMVLRLMLAQGHTNGNSRIAAGAAVDSVASITIWLGLCYLSSSFGL